MHLSQLTFLHASIFWGHVLLNHSQLVNLLLGPSENSPPFPEVSVLRDRSHAFNETSLMSIGEGWSGPAPELMRSLYNTVGSLHLHGYGLHPAGHPPLVDAAIAFIDREYSIESPLASIGLSVGICTTGTRSIMQDFSRLVRSHARASACPIVITTSPDWGYADLFRQLGYLPAYVDLEPGSCFQPNLGKLRDVVSQSIEVGTTAILIIASHHSPTGRIWSKEIVTEFANLAIQHGIAILIDEAHCFSSTVLRPTTATADVVAAIKASGKCDHPWLAVQSYGKLFDCNGWGIGHFLGPAGIVSDILLGDRFARYYTSLGFLQEALAHLLVREEECREVLLRKATRLSKRRFEAYSILRKHGLGVREGDQAKSGPFVLLPAYSCSEGKALSEIAKETGVVLSGARFYCGRCVREDCKCLLLRAFVDVEESRLRQSIESVAQMLPQLTNKNIIRNLYDA